MSVERDPAGTGQDVTTRSGKSGDTGGKGGGGGAGAPPTTAAKQRDESRNMLPPRERRRSRAERFLVRLIATGGIVGVGVVIAAIMTSSKSQGWLIGLVVSVVTVVLAAILWSSRQM